MQRRKTIGKGSRRWLRVLVDKGWLLVGYELLTGIHGGNLYTTNWYTRIYSLTPPAKTSISFIFWHLLPQFCHFFSEGKFEATTNNVCTQMVVVILQFEVITSLQENVILGSTINLQSNYFYSSKLMNLLTSNLIVPHFVLTIYTVYQHPLQVCASHNVHPQPLRKQCTSTLHPSTFHCYSALKLCQIWYSSCGQTFFHFPFFWPVLRTSTIALIAVVVAIVKPSCGQQRNDKKTNYDRVFKNICSERGVGWGAMLIARMGQTPLLLALVPLSC